MVYGLTHMNILSTQLYTHSLLFNHLLTVRSQMFTMVNIEPPALPPGSRAGQPSAPYPQQRVAVALSTGLAQQHHTHHSSLHHMKSVLRNTS